MQLVSVSEWLVYLTIDLREHILERTSSSDVVLLLFLINRTYFRVDQSLHNNIVSMSLRMTKDFEQEHANLCPCHEVSMRIHIEQIFNNQLDYIHS